MDKLHRRSTGIVAFLALTGCASIGPKKIARDRFEYATALSDTWKTQLLGNVVRVRYAEAPVFLSVESAIASYTFDASVNAGAAFAESNSGTLGVTAPLAADIAEVRSLLGIGKDVREVKATFGILPKENEVAILTRSVLEILFELALYVDVPAAHVAEHRAAPGYESLPEDWKSLPPLLRVRSGSSPPRDSFVSTRHRNTWFWIEDTDLQSKGAFSFLMFLMTLTETGGRNLSPLLTVPAG